MLITHFRTISRFYEPSIVRGIAISFFACLSFLVVELKLTSTLSRNLSHRNVKSHDKMINTSKCFPTIFAAIT